MKPSIWLSTLLSLIPGGARAQKGCADGCLEGKHRAARRRGPRHPQLHF
jgi:hypothetical protein